MMNSLARPSAQQSGMTLVELMVTISIAALLLTLAAPSMKSLIQRNKAAVVASEFKSSLYLIRSNALTTRQDTYLCAANADHSDCQAGNNFDNGWLAWVDCNNDGSYSGSLKTCDLDDDGAAESTELLKVTDMTTHKASLKISSTESRFNFQLSGRGATGSVCVAAKNGQGSKIIVSRSGRVSSEAVENCN